MKDSDIKKPKEKQPEVDFTNVSPDDIAKRFLETPPKPKTKKEKDKP
ncbi:MAG: hypothetical protein ACLP2P_05340 [Desulfobaccales bacterium]